VTRALKGEGQLQGGLGGGKTWAKPLEEGHKNLKGGASRA
jgi:hypothetical protein